MDFVERYYIIVLVLFHNFTHRLKLLNIDVSLLLNKAYSKELSEIMMKDVCFISMIK